MSKGATFFLSFFLTLLICLGLIFMVVRSQEESQIEPINQQEFQVEEGVDLNELEPSN